MKRKSEPNNRVKRRIEDLHNRIQLKEMQQWRRQQAGRFHCIVFGSPAKPKLQAKENFLVSHMSLRGEG
jgi:hypothetical protein